MVSLEGRKLFLDIMRSHGLKIHLAKTEVVGELAAIGLADMEEADFVGYSPITPAVFGDPEIDEDGVASIKTAILTWTAGAIVAPQTIRGVYVTTTNPANDGEPELLFFENITPTVTLASAGEEFKRIVRLKDTNFSI